MPISGTNGKHQLIAMAAAHCQAGRLGEAESCFRDLLALDPDSPQLWIIWAQFLANCSRSVEALAAVHHARRLDPGIVSHHNLFNLSMDAMDVESAVAAAGWAAEATPDNAADWSRWLLHLHYLPLPPQDITKAHRDWGIRHPDPGWHFPVDRDPSRRLRIGYVSPFRSNWAVQHFLNPVFSAHDPAQVEVFAYQTLQKGDFMSDLLKAKVHHWRETGGWSDERFSEQVRSDRIDLLVDLTGHSWENRLSAMANRLAPIQFTWLGYPGTTGVPAMDFRITDAVADPPGSESDYTERLVRLPVGFLCYQAPNPSPAVTPSPCAENGFVTFCSMNIPAKLSHPTFALWAEVLRACPGSRMVFKFARDNWKELGRTISDRFGGLGIHPDRIEVLPFLASFESHLLAYGNVDIALDPFPYNGTTTTCEALWMGVPVVALRGERHAARVSASILTSLGLEELIGEDEQDYLSKAVGLARDPKRVGALREGMRSRMRASPLMDGPAFTRDLEGVFRRCWTDWCAHRTSG